MVELVTGEPVAEHVMTLTKGDVMKKYEEDRQKRQKLHEEQQAKRKYHAAMDDLGKLERQIEALKALRNPVAEYTIKPKNAGKDSEAVALVCLSDWHVEEVVLRDHVGGLNEYSPEIARSRAAQCFQKIIRLIIKEQQDVSIKTLIVWLGGDFFSGNIHEELLETCAMPPIEAAMYAQELIYNGLVFLRQHFKGEIVVVCNSGNHARISDKVHISTEYGNSLETFMYCALRQKLNTGFKWVIPEGYFAKLTVFDKVLRFHHGTHIKYGGGIGGVTIPMIKAINGWNTAERADHDIVGHFHQYLQHRRFTINGSLIGYSPYAIAIKAEYEPPCQAMFLWDAKRGKSVSIPILFRG